MVSGFENRRVSNNIYFKFQMISFFAQNTAYSPARSRLFPEFPGVSKISRLARFSRQALDKCIRLTSRGFALLHMFHKYAKQPIPALHLQPWLKSTNIHTYIVHWATTLGRKRQASATCRQIFGPSVVGASAAAMRMALQQNAPNIFYWSSSALFANTFFKSIWTSSLGFVVLTFLPNWQPLRNFVTFIFKFFSIYCFFKKTIEFYDSAAKPLAKATSERYFCRNLANTCVFSSEWEQQVNKWIQVVFVIKRIKEPAAARDETSWARFNKNSWKVWKYDRLRNGPQYSKLQKWKNPLLWATVWGMLGPFVQNTLALKSPACGSTLNLLVKPSLAGFALDPSFENYKLRANYGIHLHKSDASAQLALHHGSTLHGRVLIRSETNVRSAQRHLFHCSPFRFVYLLIKRLLSINKSKSNQCKPRYISICAQKSHASKSSQAIKEDKACTFGQRNRYIIFPNWDISWTLDLTWT